MRRAGWFAVTGTALLVVALAGCGASKPHRRPQGQAATATGPPPATSTARPAPATGAPAPPASAAGPARRDRVVLVLEENHEFDQVIGNGAMPFLNSLAARGTLLERSYAVAHPSLPNYLALLGGDTFGVRSDCTGCHVGARNLVDQLEAAGHSWAAYMEGLPAPCATAAQAGAYAKKHDPFLYFDDIRDDPARCRQVVPFDRLGADLAAGRLADFVFVTPNLDDDLHDGSPQAADAWLARLYRSLTASPAWGAGTRLVVTFDEGGSGAACCGAPGGGHIATVIAGPAVPAGARDATPYNHYALLASVEALFGLGRLGHAADPGVHLIPALASR